METILPEAKSDPTFVQEPRPCGEMTVTSSTLCRLLAGLGPELAQDAHLLMDKRISTYPDDDHFDRWYQREQLQYTGYTEAIRRC